MLIAVNAVVVKSSCREKGRTMIFRSRIYANSNGQTIDAIGEGNYLVCNASYCVMVKGLHQAHATLNNQKKVIF